MAAPSHKTLKMILSGLDNAGKSSMLVVMKKMYQFEDTIHNLRPTAMIDYYNRKFLGYSIDIWDMGGQEKFRERYLKRSMYFDELNVLIYLIDVTDTDRIHVSLQYLDQVLQILREGSYNKNEEIFVCFTKMDFDRAFTERPEYIANLSLARRAILDKYKDFKFDFFSTSIYNTYSIIKMLSKGLGRNIVGYKEIQDSMEDFGIANEFHQFLLFDHTGLIIADYINSLKPLDRNSVDQIISENLAFFKKVEDQQMGDFRGFKSMRGELMNIGYQCKLNKGSGDSDNHALFFSVIIDPILGKKSNWRITEIIEKIRVLLSRLE